jgi:hypothetical protein
MDINIVMPFTGIQFLEGLLFIVMLFGVWISLQLRHPLIAAMFVIMACAFLWFVSIQPALIAAMPSDIPPNWKEAYNTALHPETWFNITVVFPGGAL